MIKEEASKKVKRIISSHNNFSHKQKLQYISNLTVEKSYVTLVLNSTKEEAHLLLEPLTSYHQRFL